MSHKSRMWSVSLTLWSYRMWETSVIRTRTVGTQLPEQRFVSRTGLCESLITNGFSLSENTHLTVTCCCVVDLRDPDRRTTSGQTRPEGQSIRRFTSASERPPPDTWVQPETEEDDQTKVYLRCVSPVSHVVIIIIISLSTTKNVRFFSGSYRRQSVRRQDVWISLYGDSKLMFDSLWHSLLSL